MHDAKGRELKVGDSVLIPCVVTGITTTEDYCNITMETKFGRRPDGIKEYIGGINSGVVLRDNVSDKLDNIHIMDEVINV